MSVFYSDFHFTFPLAQHRSSHFSEASPTLIVNFFLNCSGREAVYGFGLQPPSNYDGVFLYAHWPFFPSAFPHGLCSFLPDSNTRFSFLHL